MPSLKEECLESHSTIVLLISSLNLYKYFLEVILMTLLPSPLHYLFESHCCLLLHVNMEAERCWHLTGKAVGDSWTKIADHCSLPVILIGLLLKGWNPDFSYLYIYILLIQMVPDLTIFWLYGGMKAMHIQ